MHSLSGLSLNAPGGPVRPRPDRWLPEELSLPELTELIPAIACSSITTSYIARIESVLDNSADANSHPSPGQVLIRVMSSEVLWHASPGLALGSCLVLGCCLSSYAHRRRDQDQYQTIVFAIWIVWAVWVGWGIGTSADVVTLGIVPWALCAAMLSSFVGHLGARWLATRARGGYGHVVLDATQEKNAPLES
ncbi:hypothetical protein GGS23DRAFT_303028 [Durotheca rogersii]|uniref:uncharacterized protein n=1 Tax=Durotheca rogersii TaxID=419775 RepID=UPI00221F2C6B|nr:uncharacterized protein GGS23DRAFT_303028 [Durotheca rogersii]KAI5867049.1 hypothetical protein GGS23DRAFT_303028 [Durotheca rogersii]